tara:strand:- start:939 stop:1136 length:198 start_codon:yes stop_codon:yes gene_type:complete
MRINKSHTTIHGGPGPKKRVLADKKYVINEKLKRVVVKHQRGFLSDRQKAELIAEYQKELREILK